MPLKRIIYALLLISSIVVSCKHSTTKNGADSVKSSSRSSDRPPVRTEGFVVSPMTVQDYIEIPGNILAFETALTQPQVAGVISGIYFKEGAFVNKGDMLFKLDDDELQAQLKKLEVQEKIALQNEQRSAELQKIGGISKQEYETSQLTAGNIAADIVLIKVQIAKMYIRAPFSGKVGLRMVSVGAYVTPSTTLTTISEVRQLKIDFTVPEKYSSKIKTGQLVSFNIDASKSNYVAKIIATEPGVNEDTRTLHVRATVINNLKDLMPGVFARVKLQFEPETNALMIPTQAIISQLKGKKVFIYENGLAQSVNVTTGLRDSSRIQITSGLKSGDTVLLTGLLSLRPGGKVILSNLNKKSLVKK